MYVACVHVCVCVCVHVCMYWYVYVCSVCVCTSMCERMHVNMCMCAYMFVCSVCVLVDCTCGVYVSVHTYNMVCVYMCECVWEVGLAFVCSVCVLVRVCKFAYLHTCVLVYMYKFRYRPESNMLKNLPKMLTGISLNFHLLCCSVLLLC